MSILTRVKHNPVIHTLLTVQGNQRACLYTEPLWGIPYNLYLPFVSVYMAALGMSAMQIGLVSTVFLASQMVFSIFSGVITDKLGRRLTTLIFDTLSWSVPALLWMVAQDFRWFIVAALFNGAWRVTETSWGLLLIEGAPSDKLVHMYSISHIAGLIAGFFAPIAYFFVQRYTVVPTMRFLYGLTFVMMTTKFVLLYFITKETEVGMRRMEDSKNVRILSRLWDSRKVLGKMLRNKRTLYTVLLLTCFTGANSVNANFWPLLVTEKLGIATENLSIFSTIKSLLMLLFYFTIVPRLNIRYFRNPLLFAFLLLLGQEILMLVMPAGAYWLVLVTVVMEAVAMSVLNPMTSSLQMLNIDREERARMLGFFYAICMLLTSPLGTLAGMLAESNRSLPFVLNIGLTVGAMALSLLIWRTLRNIDIDSDEA